MATYGQAYSVDVSGEEELEVMKRKVQEMEEETSKLREMQAQAERDMNLTPAAVDHEKEEVDRRSIHVGNVDYAVTPEQLQSHFQACGVINRITIMCDKYTGHPKGFAYIEFADPTCVANAAALNETVLNSRAIKVTPKRTNIPGLGRHSQRPRGGRGRGGYFPPSYPVAASSPYQTFPYGGYNPRGFMPMRGRGSFRGGIRGRGSYPGYAPY